MRTWKVLAAASAGLILAGGFAPSPSLAAEATTVTSLTVPAAPVDVETSPGAVIRAHITDPVGVTRGNPDEGANDVTHVCVAAAARPASATDCAAMGGKLISGTAQDGEWEFYPFVGNRPDGVWEARWLNVVRLDDTRQLIDLRSLPFPRTFSTVGAYDSFVDRQSPRFNQITTIVYGDTVTVRARLFWVDKVTSRRYPIGKRRVRILQSPDATSNSGERLLATVTTAADGTFAAKVRPDRNVFRLTLRWDKGATVGGIRYDLGSGSTGRVYVKARLGIQSKPTKLRVKKVGYVRGTVAPATHAGQKVYLQRYSKGAWRNVGSAAIRGGGKFTLAVRPMSKGTFRYRVYKPGDAVHAANVTAAFKIKGR